MSDITISSGVVSSGLVVSAAALTTVLSGGTVFATSVDGYGTLIVSSGGYASGTTVSANGFEQTVVGATVSGTTISYNGQEIVGGTAINSTDDGSQIVVAGGVADDTQVPIGIVTVDSNGLAVSTNLGNSSYAGAQLIVSAGGTAIEPTLSAGVEGYINGLEESAVISGGFEEVLGLTVDTDNGFVYSGGTAIDTVIANSGTLELDDGNGAAGNITFNGLSGTLEIGVPGYMLTPNMPTVPISGFARTDKIDLTDVVYTGNGSATFNDGILTVTEGGESYTLNLAGVPNGATFRLFADGGLGHGTDVLASYVPCFAAGTLISTQKGEIAVEKLAVDDLVATVEGDFVPVVWIGHRHVNLQHHTKPSAVQPVRIVAHAFALNQPKVDLLLSPDHAVFIEDVLIPIRYLINGATVHQETRDAIDYYHVELPVHSILYAAGLPTESYLDTGDRFSFGKSSVSRLHPIFGSELHDTTLIMDSLGYAPLCVTGEKVARVQTLLASRAKSLKIRHRVA